MGAYTNSRDAYASKTFSGQLLVTMVLNWLINFLWQWGSMGGFSSFASALRMPHLLPAASPLRRLPCAAPAASQCVGAYNPPPLSHPHV